MAGFDVEMKTQLLAITGFQEGMLPFEYIGNPLASVKLKIAYYSPLMDFLIRKIKAWLMSTHSILCRESIAYHLSAPGSGMLLDVYSITPLWYH